MIAILLGLVLLAMGVAQSSATPVDISVAVRQKLPRIPSFMIRTCPKSDVVLLSRPPVFVLPADPNQTQLNCVGVSTQVFEVIEVT